ncbi:Glycosyltransferase, GT2 family [Chitinophaga sp. CF118]|uniref:glycosyltransferase family 2 protein n=1 Tax=Chitinophaga sp. CF118 TaxID=1884367 RepID=UPI0008E96232|nr:glycosyltransferase family A protein [Chitinophaga sp. CF118]SFF06799.1 Glycosyltransferase, GT2 family [Chitinophaga sp. CF118]
MNISVVIPTYNRKKNLVALLNNLSNSTHPVSEVIIVDAGTERLTNIDYPRLNIQHLSSIPSVCVQRNIGIRAARSEWIFLCDDDIEVPYDYLQKINTYIQQHPEAGAISGLVLQQENGEWTATYPVYSSKQLIIRYIFGLSIWGEIRCVSKNLFIKRIKRYYARKGNHIARSGWPVITDFSGENFTVPVFGLGASVIRKDWLEHSPYDETLDKYGIGDNYGVSIGFPGTGIHILNNAFVYHHQERVNRLVQPLQYYRRVLALDYFIRTKKELQNVIRLSFIWSLFGNILVFLSSGNWLMVDAGKKAFFRILFRKNPYAEAAACNKTIIEPKL